MIKDCLKGVNTSHLKNIYITILKEHFDKYLYSDYNLLKKIMGTFNCKFLILKNQTKSQCETVIETIKYFNITGSIFIKDVDNSFKFKPESKNEVCYIDISKFNINNKEGKSYLKLDKDIKINKIVEKKVISNYVCVGGYSFKDSKDYLNGYNVLKDKLDRELYTSDIIDYLIKNNISFYGKYVSKYEDWGTKEEWLEYKNTFKTIFLDIDGCIFKNTGEFTKPSWGYGEPLKENIENVRELYDSGRIQIILTTARKEKYREETINQLEKHNVPFDDIIFNLYHCKRFLINDYSLTNPKPSAVSINIERNSKLEL